LLLYYITDRTQFAGNEQMRRCRLLLKVAEAARSGVDLIQLREKDLSTRELETLAHACLQAVRESSLRTENRELRTGFLINSRVDVAIACGADGVHLRSGDISPRDAQLVWAWGASALAREKPLIGVSCHTSAEVARAASEGADFAVFAPVFEKKNVPGSGAGLEALREACRLNVRVLALGGVTLENARSCIEAGASGIAGIRLFQEADIAQVVRKLRD
jgi:thiamine-phosphate pyrophosphorylase